MDVSDQLQCVGKLEIVKPKPVGFLCGTLPVPTDCSFPASHSAIVPTPHIIAAPRYQMLPAETDLNALPELANFPEKVIPDDYKNSKGLQCDSIALSQSLFKKCEALAVSGLTEYGDEIDVVAPTDILKQIFKIPYSKAQLSIAVQRIGDTLILNAGPKVEEEEKLLRRQSNQATCPDPSIFLNFAMHSVRAEACDCPPAHKPSPQQQESSHGLPGNYGLMEDVYASSTYSHLHESQFLDQNSGGGKNPSHSNKDKYFLRNKMSKQKNTRTDSVKSTSQIGAKPRSPILESEKRRRPGHNDFLRVLFWKFHNFRMLLGSDILLFSNDKYVAVSLHLWDVTRQVTPLTWLEAWLDNVMANVPELAICYHQDGVVQGYELLKTDEIFLLKGVSEDGTPAFHPQVVQQNGLSVLRFLQENCKHDPGAYWLYKSAGEDVIQLFDLSVLPKNHPDDDDSKSPSSILSLMQKGRRDTLFSLGTLLYRIAHRLSLSKAPSNRIKCARFFKKCLDFLHEKDHMVIRAYAHEQFARLILKSYDELELATDTYLLEPEVRVTNLEGEYSEISFSMFGASGQGQGHTQITEAAAVKDGDIIPSASSDESVKINLEANSHYSQNVSMQAVQEARKFSRHIASCKIDGVLDMCHIINNSPILVKSVADPISSKLAAVHHVTQAIKSLRWKRQLQNAQGMDPGNRFNERSLTKVNLSLCTCGDLNCIEICDIREWLPKAKMDQKMWNLVLLLGESYLALGEAYKDDEQLQRALKVVELACLVYGSMPQHLDDAQYISSLGSGESYQLKVKEGDGIPKSFIDCEEDLNFKLFQEGFLSDRLFPIYLFWPKAWALVGDVYVEYQRKNGNKVQEQEFDRRSGSDLRVSNEVVREVKRLKKKLGQSKQNCSSCSLLNCSCQSDRARSGNSASSSCSGNVIPSYRRKHNRKLHSRTSVLLDGNTNGSGISCGSDYLNSSENEHLESSKEENKHEVSTKPSDACSTFVNKLKASNSFEKDSNPTQAVCHGSRITNVSKVVDGGIFRFLEGPKPDNLEFNLKTAMYCYDEARKAMNGFPVDSAEFSSILKRKGWVSNELGRYRLNKKDLASAEIAFDDAILAFKEISDHTNIILINCNLGHGRRSLAEELVSQLDELRGYGILQNAYKQAIKAAKAEYLESLNYYLAAKMELDSMGSSEDNSLRNEVYTQLAHTYLRLGMLLASEIISDDVPAITHGKVYSNLRSKDELKNNMSAGDAFREALSIYESLGVLRKQEAAFSHFQLASFHKGTCLKILDLQNEHMGPSNWDNKHLKAKWYASLADKHWRKAIDFYGPSTHPVMYINILLEQAALSLDLSKAFHSIVMLETSLLHLLDGRHIVQMGEDCELDQDCTIKSKFWIQLQSLLKSMVSSSLSGGSNRAVASASSPAARYWDASKVKEMYRMSLKSTSFSQLHAMYKLWLS